MLKTLILLLFFQPLIHASEVSIVSYNVENLFDSLHDEGHEDFTYLPKKNELKKKCKDIKNSYYRKYCKKLNWTSKKVEKKINQHRKVLKALPLVPDFLALVEIENIKLVKKFEDLVKDGKSLITKGDDERGIHCALIYNSKDYKLLSKKEHKTLSGSRNVLEVLLKGGKGVVAVFVTHWPSQRSPTERRLLAARVVADRVKELKKKNPKMGILVVGDFNTLEIEQPHPFYNGLLDNTGLVDSADKKSGGSYFYKPSMSWNLLDRVFYSSDSLTLKEFKVFRPEFATTVTEYRKKGKSFWGSRVVGVPKDANHHSLKNIGYSDHFPVYGIFTWGK